MTWTDDDVRDEMDEQEEDQLWIDSKGKIVESAFCSYFLQKRPLIAWTKNYLIWTVRSTRSGCAMKSIRRSGRLPAMTPPKGQSELWMPSRWSATGKNGTPSWTGFI